jgi:CBS domain-containing protein
MLGSEVMSARVRAVTPDQSVGEAARLMLDEDIGALVVTDRDQVAGILTDRDIAVRGVAMGRGADARVSELMSGGDIVVAYDDQDLDEVAIMMSDRQVRRIPVLERATGRLCGVLSLGDLARTDDFSTAEAALAGASQHGGEHDQSLDGSAGRST